MAKRTSPKAAGSDHTAEIRDRDRTITELRERLEEANQRSDGFEEERRQAQDKADETEEENSKLRGRLDREENTNNRLTDELVSSLRAFRLLALEAHELDGSFEDETRRFASSARTTSYDTRRNDDC
jgi:chromosome segregation ATPase